jgi:maltose alpha-D-glucosyltransferase/alpha-amylase
MAGARRRDSPVTGGRGKPRVSDGASRERLSTGFDPDPTWYQDAVIYEVHVRAFMDSSGDGIGDFKGLTARLDYLSNLGVTAIWLLPFYPSPLRDDGYDIADYTAVHPDYGTLRDVRTFIREAHRRQLRVITELVFNHTSDQHPWFKRARRAKPGSRERDWYVWSETPDRYADARVIFKDFEASNWSWDAVAGAYFWHRFYSHQPDLNFDQPAVRAALLKSVDFWLQAGVDGLRLDAIPYLYERDGTNGENLPETHAFLKGLRRHIDERFADRMLLAEANQWPEDSVAYFGDGDECHMSFHFPLMPRMFMSLRMEDRFPIIDILEQTPDIPDNAQWALFLRNHDELTLEMVTDEERDYMYRVYAADPQARINLGIRRRLAPLLGNDRRRIELMNGLLFSLPGTPVIYYGDEIGMGDNVYVGDRNGVRTPMQWSSDRNAGFSAANRQRLYLPVVTDPEYHHEAVNVEAQQSNPHSLLWWMKRVIALRKRHPAFGRGSLRFLHPENRRILAYIREYQDETILVIANLSRYAQWTELPLGDYEGRVPVELFGSVEFPRVGAEPYLVNLGPHSFLWFRLTADPLTEELSAASRTDLPELAWSGDLVKMLLRGSGDVADVLLRWMLQRRWYRGKARQVQTAKVVDAITLPSAQPPAAVALLLVEYRDAEPETYVLPLATDEGFDAVDILAEAPHGAIAKLVGGAGSARLLDGALVPGVFEALLGIVSGRRHLHGSKGDLIGLAVRGLRSQSGPLPESMIATPLRADHSNSSAVYSDRLVMKVYRTLEDGPNPDLEVPRFLVEHGFKHVPPVLGSVEVRRAGTSSATLAMLQAFVPHEGNLWEATIQATEAYLRDAEAESIVPEREDDSDTFLLDLSRREAPEAAHRLMGTSMQTARIVGERIGQMHATLASADASDAIFAPEPMTQLHVRGMYQSIRRSVSESMEMLQARRSTLPPHDQLAAGALLDSADRIEALLTRLREVDCDGDRIRIHGDLHLGQVLDTGSDVMIIDFEGEPGRRLSERRLKRPALTDLAGMIRSYHSAADWPRLKRRLDEGDGHDSSVLAAWSTFWAQWASASCIAGYRSATEGAAFLPSTDLAWSVLLKSLLVAKACYEVRYELGSRPEWVGIPIAGLRALIGDGPDSDI